MKSIMKPQKCVKASLRPTQFGRTLSSRAWASRMRLATRPRTTAMIASGAKPSSMRIHELSTAKESGKNWRMTLRSVKRDISAWLSRPVAVASDRYSSSVVVSNESWSRERARVRVVVVG